MLTNEMTDKELLELAAKAAEIGGGDEMTPLQAMKDALGSLGRFTGEEGSTEDDFRIMDNLIVAIEEIEKAKPVAWRIKQFNEDGEMCGWIYHQIRNEGQPIYTHPAPAIPEGWLLVPIEPNAVMVDAGDAEIDPGYCEESSSSRFVEDGESIAIYKAMLAAAPEYKP